MWDFPAVKAGGRSDATQIPTRVLESMAWSPDGSQLAFSLFGPPLDDKGGDANYVYVMNSDGSGMRQILMLPGPGPNSGGGIELAWSPDGSRIAFVHDGELFTMAPDGTDMRPVSGIHPDGPIAWNWAS